MKYNINFFVLFFSSIYLNADFKFSLNQNIDNEEIKLIKEKKIVYSLPKKNILNVIDKELLNKKIENSNFKIINLEKYNDKVGLKDKNIIISVSIDGLKNINYLEYTLKYNKWYIIRKDSNILKFFEYKPLSKKDFNLYDTYLKISNNNFNLLIKKNNKFKPLKVNIKKSVLLYELNPNSFKTIKYKLKIVRL